MMDARLATIDGATGKVQSREASVKEAFVKEASNEESS